MKEVRSISWRALVVSQYTVRDKGYFNLDYSAGYASGVGPRGYRAWCVLRLSLLFPLSSLLRL